jgi:hypothetical protein
LAISQRVRVQVFPTLCQLSCWNTAWWLNLVLAMTLLPHSKRCQMGSISSQLINRQRCIIISTLLGHKRTSKRQPKPQDKRYCY